MLLLAAASAATLDGSQVGVVDTPVLAPDAEIRTFLVPEGYRVELVATEPLIQDPVLIDWDADGRMWAVEMPAYMTDIRGTNEHAPTGRVVVLEDANGDGRMDRRTVFADGLVLPRALKVLDRGVLVGEPPNLWLMRDTNGDLAADEKTLVTDTYGRREANVEHNANALLWALDNWIYTSEVDVLLRLRRGAFEIRRTLSRGQWGASQDDAGRVYRNTNSSVLHVDLVPTHYYARHPNLARTRGSYESLAGPNNEGNVVWPARPTPGVNRGYQAGVLRADGTLARFTAVGAPTVYRGDRLPGELYGDVFVAEPAANLVSRIRISDGGGSPVARKAYANIEFLTSTDERFRPVYLSSAPDGTLYIVDIYRGIIQHRGYITEYLRDQILSRNLEQPIGRGRVFRVAHGSMRRGPKPALSRAAAPELVRALSHPNGWWRDTAQRLIVERGDRSVVPALERIAASDAAERTRLHALWALDGLDSLSLALATRALSDGSANLRVSAVRLAERWLVDPASPIQQVLLQRMDDPNVAVRRQLAASLGELPATVRARPLAVMLGRYGDDPILADAAMSGTRGVETAVLDALLDAAETPARRAAVTIVAATIVRTAAEAPVQDLFARIANATRPEWQRSALLAGAEVALLDATMPGSAARGVAVASESDPCPTCPGARGGPGGAPAFPAATSSPRGTAAAGRSGGRGGSIGLRLTGEPPLVRVVGQGDLGRRATSVLARIDWPGKPANRPAVTPLSAAEQERFDRGKEIYQNLCQACHQPDGRGLENIAPTLIGSEFALGPPAVPIRIVLHGKEGTVGLMPPLGSGLNDDQIAGALTFIRRSWGHTGAPIDPATVTQIRGATGDRKRPWTTDELRKLGDGN
jgi:mono/diheme cytochrome c family protein/glucose/arabinose dehydrogenase